VIVQFTDKIGTLNNATITDVRFFHDRKIEAISNNITNINIPSWNFALVYRFAKQSPTPALQIVNGFIKESYISDEEVHYYRIKSGLENQVDIDERYIIRRIDLQGRIDRNIVRPLADVPKELVIQQQIEQQSFWFLEANNVTLEYLGVIALDKNEELSDLKPWLYLPRFIVGPELSYNEMGTIFRGNIGQVYGRTFRKMRTFSCSFTRIKKDLVDQFYNKVGKTTPHWVVPYPEAIAQVQPLWAVLNSEPTYTKRAENDWYWNCKLEWTEVY